MKILDVGCGYGGAALYHARNMSCRVTGITVSQTQVEMCHALAKEHGVSNKTRFVVMDAEEISFPGEDGTFDIVWTTEVLSHLHDRPAFFQHVNRLLKPGGKLFLQDWFKKEGLTEQEEAKWVKPIEYGMLLPGLATQNGLQAVYQEDVSRPSKKKTWHRLTSINNLGKIAKILICGLTLWRTLFQKPKAIGECLAFLRAFWSMKEGFDQGAFLVGVQVFEK